MIGFWLIVFSLMAIREIQGDTDICHCHPGDVFNCAEKQCSLCSRGWTGLPKCKKVCPAGTFGLNCALSCHCSLGDPCEPVTGLCESGKCAYGWTGAGCQKKMPLFSLPPNVTSVDWSSVSLQWREWSAHYDIGDADTSILGYELQWSCPAAGVLWTKLMELQLRSSHHYQYTITSLQPDTLYKFRVAVIWQESGKRKVSIPGKETVIRTTSKHVRANINIKPNTRKPKPKMKIRTTVKPKVDFKKVTPFKKITEPSTKKLRGFTDQTTKKLRRTTASTSVDVRVSRRQTEELTLHLQGIYQQDCFIKVEYKIISTYSQEANKSNIHHSEIKDCLTLQLHDLNPASKYTIDVYNRDGEKYNIGQFWTLQDTPPAPPTPIVIQVDNSTIELVLKPIQVNFMGPVSAYELVVQVVKLKFENDSQNFKLKSKLESSKDMKVFQNFTENQNYIRKVREVKLKKNLSELVEKSYVTAQLRKFNSSRNFTIGDSEYYNGYLNKPLKLGRKYNVKYCVISNLAGHSVKNCSAIFGLLTSILPPHRERKTTGGVLPGTVFLIIFFVSIPFVILAAYFAIRYRRKKKKQYEGQENYQFSHQFMTSTPARGVDCVDSDGLRCISPVNLSHTTDLFSSGKKCKVQSPKSVPKGPVKVSKLKIYCESLADKDDSMPLLQEFMSLPTMPCDSTDNADLPKNFRLNRSQDCVPYDKNRVKIQPCDDHLTDYINASIVTPIPDKKSYIVTQYPLKHTASDFWQMIWEQNVELVVLLTDTNSEDEFQPFWPEVGSEGYREITVSATSKEILAHYSIRAFELNCLGEEENRILVMFHFYSWTDENIPENVVLFMEFYQRILRVTETTDKCAVVCPNGSLKSGLFPAIDCLVREGKETNQVDVFRAVQKLRFDRFGLLNIYNQYQFIFDFLIQHFEHAGKIYDTEQLKSFLDCYDLKTEIHVEFKKLTSQQNQNPTSSTNINDNMSSLLNTSQTPFLTPVQKRKGKNVQSSPENVQNFDATQLFVCSVSSYLHRDFFLLLQCPVISQHGEFWDLVMETEASMVIVLDGLDIDDRFWPIEGEISYYGNQVVQNLQTLFNRGFDQNSLFVLPDNGACTVERGLFQLYLTCWDKDMDLPPLQETMDLLQTAMKRWSDMGHGQVVVVCECGQQRAGLFCLLWTLTEMLQTDKAVDVYHTTKYLQEVIPEFNITIDPYKFCYRFLQEYVSQQEEKTHPKQYLNQRLDETLKQGPSAGENYIMNGDPMSSRVQIDKSNSSLVTNKSLTRSSMFTEEPVGKDHNGTASSLKNGQIDMNKNANHSALNHLDESVLIIEDLT